MPQPTVVGVDPSLTGTGVSNGIWCDTLKTTPVGDDLDARRHRITTITDWVRDRTKFADLVVIEGPALGARYGHAWDRAGLWWAIINRLRRDDIPVAIAPPTTRARYATGRGNASKDQVLAATIRRYQAVQVGDNNQADALILAAMGYDHLSHPLVTVPKAHGTALTGVAWPLEVLGGVA